jgi:anti-sigma factor RsiW
MNREEPTMGNAKFDECLNADSAEVLFAYVDGTLESGQAAALESHTAGCVACRTLVEGQRAVWSVLDQWEAPEVSPEFNRKLHAAVAAGEGHGGWIERVSSWIVGLSPGNLMVPAGALALVVAAVMLTQMPRGTGQVVEQKAGIEGEVKQMERTLDDLDVLSTLDAALADEKLPQEKL